jgi:hypothetical protein
MDSEIQAMTTLWSEPWFHSSCKAAMTMESQCKSVATFSRAATRLYEMSDGCFASSGGELAAEMLHRTIKAQKNSKSAICRREQRAFFAKGTKVTSVTGKCCHFL